MRIDCVWEHHGEDTLLYAANLPGAFTRGASLQEAMEKMPAEARAYLNWAGEDIPEEISVNVIQNASCALEVRDADSDVLFEREKAALTSVEYQRLKALALQSATDFYTLYAAIPNKEQSNLPIRKTFYGLVPRTAEEMYRHTRNVNAYYFGEIGVDADNEGTILECRSRGFEQLEKQPGFLQNSVQEGSYGENWTVRKMLRRFIWHDRIHAKALYRMAVRCFGVQTIPNPFGFSYSERTFG